MMHQRKNKHDSQTTGISIPFDQRVDPDNERVDLTNNRAEIVMWFSATM